MIGEVDGLIRLYGVLAMLQLKPGSTGGVSHETAYYMSDLFARFSLMYQVDSGSLQEMRTWGQSKILEYGRWKLGTKSM